VAADPVQLSKTLQGLLKNDPILVTSNPDADHVVDKAMEE
jgi:hypothetical protein